MTCLKSHSKEVAEAALSPGRHPWGPAICAEPSPARHLSLTKPTPSPNGGFCRFTAVTWVPRGEGAPWEVFGGAESASTPGCADGSRLSVLGLA